MRIAEDSDDLIHIHRGWWDIAAANLLHGHTSNHTIEDIVYLIGEANVTIDNITTKPEFQKLVYRAILQKNLSFSLEESLRYRFVRCEWFDAGVADYLAPKAACFLRDVATHVPPCVLFAVICTYFNGWCTSDRFQELEEVCLLCNDCDGFDSIEHYACCIFAWKVYGSKFRKPIFPRSLVRFLGLSTDEIDDKVLYACHMYAVKFAVDFRRRAGTTSGPHQVGSLVWQGFKTASLHHKGLAKRFTEMWVT